MTAADAQAARWARREQLPVLLSRAASGVLLPEEGARLRAAVETELANAEQAHADRDRLAAELETMIHVARVNGRAHRYAYLAGEDARAERDRYRAALRRLDQMATAWRQQLGDTIDPATVADAIRTTVETALGDEPPPDTSKTDEPGDSAVYQLTEGDQP